MNFFRETLSLALYLAALGHFVLLIAAGQVPYRLHWKTDLAHLTDFNRKLMWTYAGTTLLTIIAFGILTLALHDAFLARDHPAAVAPRRLHRHLLDPAPHHRCRLAPPHRLAQRPRLHPRPHPPRLAFRGPRRHLLARYHLELPQMKIPLLEELKPLDRWPYFWWGSALMAIKYNLDRAIAWLGFQRQWYLWNYIRPHGFASVQAVPPQDQSFYIILLATALPFLAVGIYLTLRRLRSAGLPLALCLLFFLPIINLIFFLTLCVVPSRQTLERASANAGWETWLPRSPGGSALASVFIVGTAGVAMTCLSTEVLKNYGWGLFVGEPFAMGLVSVLIYAWPSRRTFPSCLGVAALTTIFVGLCLLAIALEGFICLVMAAPIGLSLALLGGGVGYVIADIHHSSLRPTQTLFILLAVPFMMGMEGRLRRNVPAFQRHEFRRDQRHARSGLA